MAATKGNPRLPSPAAGLLQLARMRAGISQRELARRAGVPATMVSAYERDLRQPTLRTLIGLLRAAGYEPRIRLEPLNTADDVPIGPAEGDEGQALLDQMRVWRSATVVR